MNQGRGKIKAILLIELFADNYFKAMYLTSFH